MPAPVVNTVPLDAGLIYVGATAWGVTRGGVRFTNGKEIRAIEFDGKRTPRIVGHDRVVGFDPTVEFEIIEFTSAIMQRLEPGAAVVVAGGVTTITPLDAGTMIPSANYLTNFVVAWKLPDGTFVRLRFPKALVVSYEGPGGEDKNEAGATVRVAAAQDPAAGGYTTDDAPYVLELSPLATTGL